MPGQAAVQFLQMRLLDGVYPVAPAEYPRAAAVWEASVRATHHFVSEQDITIFRPLVRAGLAQVRLACVRGERGVLAGFVGAARLLRHAITAWGADRLDVNEQNDAALRFYLHMGFVVVGRSERDGQGKPYPLLHMRYAPARDEI